MQVPPVDLTQPQVLAVDQAQRLDVTQPQVSPQPQDLPQSPVQTDPAAVAQTPGFQATQGDAILQQVQADLGGMANAVPQAMVDLAQSTLNPANATGARGTKEVQAQTAALENLVNELPGAQSVEQERTPEISAELQSWMEKVGSHEEKTPEKIVVADKTAANPTGVYAADPVIVLPMTDDSLQKGMKHPLQDSVKWLAVWCVRIMKKFHGMVVYRTTPTPTSTQE